MTETATSSETDSSSRRLTSLDVAVTAIVVAGLVGTVRAITWGLPGLGYALLLASSGTIIPYYRHRYQEEANLISHGVALYFIGGAGLVSTYFYVLTFNAELVAGTLAWTVFAAVAFGVVLVNVVWVVNGFRLIVFGLRARSRDEGDTTTA